MPVTQACDGFVTLGDGFNLEALLSLLPKPVTALLHSVAYSIWSACYARYTGL